MVSYLKGPDFLTVTKVTVNKETSHSIYHVQNSQKKKKEYSEIKKRGDKRRYDLPT